MFSKLKQNMLPSNSPVNLQAPPQPTISMPGTKSNKSYYEEDEPDKQQSGNAVKKDAPAKKLPQKDDGKQGNGQR